MKTTLLTINVRAVTLALIATSLLLMSIMLSVPKKAEAATVEDVVERGLHVAVASMDVAMNGYDREVNTEGLVLGENTSRLEQLIRRILELLEILKELQASIGENNDGEYPVELTADIDRDDDGTEAEVSLAIKGFNTNTKIDHWVLEVTCENTRMDDSDGRNKCDKDIEYDESDYDDSTEDIDILSGEAELIKDSKGGEVELKLTGYTKDDDGDSEWVGRDKHVIKLSGSDDEDAVHDFYIDDPEAQPDVWEEGERSEIELEFYLVYDYYGDSDDESAEEEYEVPVKIEIEYMDNGDAVVYSKKYNLDFDHDDDDYVEVSVSVEDFEPGDYRAYIIADYGDDYDETDEKNNDTYTDFEVTEKLEESTLTLTGGGLDLMSGDEVTFTAEIENAGDVDQLMYYAECSDSVTLNDGAGPGCDIATYIPISGSEVYKWKTKFDTTAHVIVSVYAYALSDGEEAAVAEDVVILMIEPEGGVEVDPSLTFEHLSSDANGNQSNTSALYLLMMDVTAVDGDVYIPNSIGVEGESSPDPMGVAVRFEDRNGDFYTDGPVSNLSLSSSASLVDDHYHIPEGETHFFSIGGMYEAVVTDYHRLVIADVQFSPDDTFSSYLSQDAGIESVEYPLFGSGGGGDVLGENTSRLEELMKRILELLQILEQLKEMLGEVNDDGNDDANDDGEFNVITKGYDFEERPHDPTLKGYVDPGDNDDVKVWFEWAASAGLLKDSGAGSYRNFSQKQSISKAKTIETLATIKGGFNEDRRYYYRIGAEGSSQRIYGEVETFIVDGDDENDGGVTLSVAGDKSGPVHLPVGQHSVEFYADIERDAESCTFYARYAGGDEAWSYDDPGDSASVHFSAVGVYPLKDLEWGKVTCEFKDGTSAYDKVEVVVAGEDYGSFEMVLNGETIAKDGAMSEIMAHSLCKEEYNDESHQPPDVLECYWDEELFHEQDSWKG